MPHAKRPGDAARAAGYVTTQESNGWHYWRPSDSETDPGDVGPFDSWEDAGAAADLDLSLRGPVGPEDGSRVRCSTGDPQPPPASVSKPPCDTFVRDAAEVAYEASADALARELAWSEYGPVYPETPWWMGPAVAAVIVGGWALLALLN